VTYSLGSAVVGGKGGAEDGTTETYTSPLSIHPVVIPVGARKVPRFCQRGE